MKIRFLSGCCVVIIIGSTAAMAAESYPFLGQVNADEVNIRAGQDTSFDKIGELRKSDPVVVIQKSYSWYKIRLPEQAKCYVSRKLVRFLRDGIGEISGDRVNIRSRPKLNATILGQLNELTRVKIIETMDEWCQIEPVEGVYGWVWADFVAPRSGKVPPPVVVQLPSRNIYEIKRQEEALQRQQQVHQTVALSGTVQLIEELSSDKHVRHQITDSQGRTFCLMGYRSILDGFLNNRVRIEGVIQDDSRFAHPVLLVTRILLVL